LDRRVVEVVAADSQTLPRIKQIMAKYHDSPMDFADASLVIAAETLNDRRIFTLDQHFRAYLIHDQFPFEIVP
jgi:predicted nucleic acid-binding protein